MFRSLEARALAQPSYPPLELAAIINARAFLSSAEGSFEEALAQYLDALATIRGELPADDYRIGRSLFNIASTEEKLGRRAEAKAHAEQALEILRKRKGGDAATVQQVEALIGRLQDAQATQR